MIYSLKLLSFLFSLCLEPGEKSWIYVLSDFFFLFFPVNTVFATGYPLGEFF